MQRLHPSSTSTEGSTEQALLSHHETVEATLASDYVVRMIRKPEGSSEKTEWTLYPIKTIVEAKSEYKNPTLVWTDGTRAVEALHTLLNDVDDEISVNPHVILTCHQHEHNHLETTCCVVSTPATEEVKLDSSFFLVLQLILLQWVARHQTQQSCQRTSDDNWRVTIDGNNEIFLGSLTDQNGLEQLFSDVLDIDATSAGEWVEMMTGSGQVIGILPRSLVHKHNLLHRGIGVFVTKDRPINLSSNLSTTDRFPEIYVHQRVATKRIFPSLYDMFVGGVSTADEPSELTAQREVAEELGLGQALTTRLSQWSDGSPILTCIVCTAYNRCLVDLYQYVMDTKSETVSWQKEEVAWGEFVPYNVIAAAADLSMQRLGTEGTWPGRYPPIQSQFRGRLPEELQSNKHSGWEKWDFVPDGLLVWNAWLEHVGARVKAVAR